MIARGSLLPPVDAQQVARLSDQVRRRDTTEQPQVELNKCDCWEPDNFLKMIVHALCILRSHSQNCHIAPMGYIHGLL